MPQAQPIELPGWGPGRGRGGSDPNDTLALLMQMLQHGQNVELGREGIASSEKIAGQRIAADQQMASERMAHEKNLLQQAFSNEMEMKKADRQFAMDYLRVQSDLIANSRSEGDLLEALSQNQGFESALADAEALGIINTTRATSKAAVELAAGAGAASLMGKTQQDLLALYHKNYSEGEKKYGQIATINDITKDPTAVLYADQVIAKAKELRTANPGLAGRDLLMQAIDGVQTATPSSGASIPSMMKLLASGTPEDARKFGQLAELPGDSGGAGPMNALFAISVLNTMPIQFMESKDAEIKSLGTSLAEPLLSARNTGIASSVYGDYSAWRQKGQLLQKLVDPNSPTGINQEVFKSILGVANGVVYKTPEAMQEALVKGGVSEPDAIRATASGGIPLVQQDQVQQQARQGYEVRKKALGELASKLGLPSPEEAWQSLAAGADASRGRLSTKLGLPLPEEVVSKIVSGEDTAIRAAYYQAVNNFDAGNFQNFLMVGEKYGKLTPEDGNAAIRNALLNLPLGPKPVQQAVPPDTSNFGMGNAAGAAMKANTPSLDVPAPLVDQPPAPGEPGLFSAATDIEDISRKTAREAHEARKARIRELNRGTLEARIAVMQRSAENRTRIFAGQQTDWSGIKLPEASGEDPYAAMEQTYQQLISGVNAANGGARSASGQVSANPGTAFGQQAIQAGQTTPPGQGAPPSPGGPPASIQLPQQQKPSPIQMPGPPPQAASQPSGGSFQNMALGMMGGR